MSDSDKGEMIWSYSRISYFCKYNWYKTYIQGDRGENNFFGELGGSLHELLELHANGEITAEEVTESFDNSFYDMSTTPPPEGAFDYQASAYNKMYDYFHRDKFWRGDVIEAEKELNGVLPSGAKFIGFIDLILDNDGLDFIDHKSSNGFKPHDLKKKIYQQYLYAYFYHQETGVYPKRLIWDFFKLPNKPLIVEFNYDDMMEAISWAEGQIELLSKLMIISNKLNVEGLWNPDLNYPPEEPLASPRAKNRNFACENLCNHRNSCKFVNGKKFNIDKLKK